MSPIMGRTDFQTPAIEGGATFPAGQRGTNIRIGTLTREGIKVFVALRDRTDFFVEKLTELGLIVESGRDIGEAEGRISANLPDLIISSNEPYRGILWGELWNSAKTRAPNSKFILYACVEARMFRESNFLFLKDNGRGAYRDLINFVREQLGLGSPPISGEAERRVERIVERMGDIIGEEEYGGQADL